MPRIRARLGKLEAVAMERTRGDIVTFFCVGEEPPPELQQVMETAEQEGYTAVLVRFTGKNYFEDEDDDREPGHLF